jgi:hypothetical protein
MIVYSLTAIVSVISITGLLFFDRPGRREAVKSN